MTGWHLRLVAIVVAVLLLVVIFVRRSQRTELEEVASPRDLARAPAAVQPPAPARAAARRAEPRLDRGASADHAEIERRQQDLADGEDAEPPATLPPAKLGAVRRSGAGRGGAAETVGAEAAKAPEAAKELTEAATASGVAPQFAAFGKENEGAALDSTASEQENVDFDASPGVYFPPNAVLGYPDRGGLELEGGTVMFWVQPVDWDGTTKLVYSFFLLRDIHTLNHNFAILTAQGSLRFQIINADGVEFDLVSPIDDWQRGEWHHVAATWGDSLMDLWIDGALVGEQAIDGIPSVQANAAAYWGSSRGNSGAGALLANGRIFTSVLGASDIAAEAQRLPQ